MSEDHELSDLVARLKTNGKLGKAQQAFATEMKEKIDEIVGNLFEIDGDFKVNIEKLDVTHSLLKISVKFEPLNDYIDLAEDNYEDESLYDDIIRIFKKFVDE